MLHLDGLLLKLTSLDPVYLRAPLVPLERVQPLRKVWAKAVLDVVVHSQVPVDNIIEVINDLIRILVKQPLQFGHFLVVVEVLLVLSIELVEDLIVVL